ncbi:MAG: hypothetical protein WAX69_07930 [Victivallales bacterium]
MPNGTSWRKAQCIVLAAFMVMTGIDASGGTAARGAGSDGVGIAAVNLDWHHETEPGSRLPATKVSGTDLYSGFSLAGEDAACRVSSNSIPLKENLMYDVSLRISSLRRMDGLRIFLVPYFRSPDIPIPPETMLLLPPPVPSGDEFAYQAAVRFFAPPGSGSMRVMIEVPAKSPPFTVHEVKCAEAFGNMPLVYVQQKEDLLDAARGFSPAPLASLPPLDSVISNIGGRLRLAIDGKPVAPLIYTPLVFTSDYRRFGQYAAFHKQGFSLHSIGINSEIGGGKESPFTFWRGAKDYDFSSLENALRLGVAASPESFFQLYVNVDPYKGWSEEHPDDICMNQKGDKAVGFQHLYRWGGIPAGNERYLPSLYSSAVREETMDMLQELVRYIERSPWSRKVAGYMLVGYCDAQFVNWAHWDIYRSENADDYSPAARKAFRMWLHQRYAGNQEALRIAWSRPDVTFESAEIPPVERRKRKDVLWLDPVRDRDVADFNRFYIEEPIDFVDALASIVKKESGGRKYIGTPYASAMNGGASGNGLGRMLDSANLNLFFCPQDYFVRIPGTQGGVQSMAGSMSLHQKLFIGEIDYRSHMRGVSAPHLCAGFRDEGGQGKTVFLGFFKDGPSGKRHLAFIGRATSPVLDICEFPWDDGKEHVYSVVKYRDLQGVFRIQLHIDGIARFTEGIEYLRLPDDEGDGEGFHVGTSSALITRAEVSSLSIEKNDMNSGADLPFVRRSLSIADGWKHYQTGGMQLKLDFPEKGSVYLNDDKASDGSAFAGFCRIAADVEKDIGSPPRSSPYRFTLAIKFLEAGFKSTIRQGDDWSNGLAYNDDAMKAMLLRETGNLLSKGHGAHFFELQPYAYASPEVHKTLGKIHETFSRDLKDAAPLEADVAIFVGERSLDYLSFPKSLPYRWYLTRLARRQWDISGVPYHLYIQGDLTDKKLPRYRMYVFVAPEHLAKDELLAIENLKKDGATLVFLHAPGIFETDDAESSIQAVSGMKVSRLPGETRYAGRYLDGTHPLLSGMRGLFGAEPISGPFPASEISGAAWGITDPQAIPLALYSSNNSVAAAAKDFGSWKSAYFAVPRLEARMLNNLAAWAGAWRVSETLDAVFANQRFISIHALTSGEKTLTLRRKAAVVTDPISGEVIARDVDRLTFFLNAGDSKWFEISIAP